MASDGRVTQDSSIFTNKLQKIVRLKSGGLFGAAGDAATDDIANLLDKLRKPLPTAKQIISLEIEFSGLWVKPDGSVFIIDADKTKEERWKASMFQINEPFFAIGSGDSYALGAMDRGASAKQAVETAIKFDSACGGPVQVFKLKEQE